jgi:GTPase
MFVDQAVVKIKAGKGGDGHLSFRRERYISKGGPDGGDGGKGGDIVFVASRNQDTLANFRFQSELLAEDGQPGGKSKKHGKNGNDKLIELPVGTVAYDPSGEVLADLTDDGQSIIMARGGRGGFGNAHFVSSVRQAPRIVEKGEPGEELTLNLELKMIADVGLVGLPNAGKSTLLAAISQARPKIANYPFTTLKPHLGMVAVAKDLSLMVADIPGLIEGASQGRGLGDEFLRHIERTKILLQLIDAWSNDVAQDYKVISGELEKYKINLSSKPRVIALTKIDGLDPEILADQKKKLAAILPKGSKIFAISAAAKTGLSDLLFAVSKMAAKENEKISSQVNSIPVIGIDEDKIKDMFSVKKLEGDHRFMVSSVKLSRFITRVDLSSQEGQLRIKDIMRKMGIARELTKLGAVADDAIEVGDKIIKF